MAMEDEGSREMLPLPKKANGKGSALKLGDGIWEMSKVIGNQQYLDFNFTGSAIRMSLPMTPVISADFNQSAVLMMGLAMSWNNHSISLIV